MRSILLPAAAGVICTAITATAVFAQSVEVVGLDGRVSVAPAALERRTVVTEDRGLRVIIASGCNE